MKLTVLAENTVCREALCAEHGLSLYIETGGYKILFDMGQSDAFARNAQHLGIDLSRVDMAVLSHGHYDHGGGLEAFLQLNAHAPVYVHASAFGKYYNGTAKYIGLNDRLQDHPRLIPVSGTLEITPDLLLHDCNALGWQFDCLGLNKLDGRGFSADEFLHEMYLQITEGEKHILLSGCAHKGICNIVSHFRPDVMIGGFHLNKLEDPAHLHAIARELLRHCGICCTGHCTGQEQYSHLKTVMGDRLMPLSAGITCRF